MRFPKINDVAAALREINKNQLEPEGADEGIDVRLQVYPDGEWAVRWGLSDYDQDHRGYWGASSVPGDNRRFNSKDVARDLIDQAKDAHAEGAGFEEPAQTVAEAPSKSIEIKIPDMPMWEQIGGDMNPATYGAILARSDGDAIELLEIQPVREYVGDAEAAEVGFPFWSKEAYYTLDDLDPARDDVQSALRSIGMEDETLSEDFTPEQRALVIAEALLGYGSGIDEGPSGWSGDIYGDSEVKWWGEGVQTIADALAEEDDEFRREVLGEEDEENEDLEEPPVREVSEMRFNKDDERVFAAFLARRSARGKRFETNGQRLDGGTFLSNVASWETLSNGRETVVLHDLGSRTAQQIHRRLKRMGGPIVKHEHETGASVAREGRRDPWEGQPRRPPLPDLRLIDSLAAKVNDIQRERKLTFEQAYDAIERKPNWFKRYYMGGGDKIYLENLIINRAKQLSRSEHKRGVHETAQEPRGHVAESVGDELGRLVRSPRGRVLPRRRGRVRA